MEDLQGTDNCQEFFIMNYIHICIPLVEGSELGWVHLDTPCGDDNAKVLDRGFNMHFSGLR